MPVKENEKYTKLTVIELVGKNKHGHRMWKCLCDCGNIVNVSTGSLTSKNTQSCGCLLKESKRKSGEKLRILNKYEFFDNYGIGYTKKKEPFYFDLEDYEKIKIYTWRYNPDGYIISISFGKIIRMHMLIMNSDGSKDADHINHMIHDNRKSNLRICEHFENIIHSKIYSNNTSGVKGVYWDKNRNKWMALITVNKKDIHLGRYDEFDDAVKARKDAEEKYHKEFIYKN